MDSRASFASHYSCTVNNNCIKEMKRQLTAPTRRAAALQIPDFLYDTYKKEYGIFIGNVHMTSSKKASMIQLILICVVNVSPWNHVGKNFVLGSIIGL